MRNLTLYRRNKLGPFPSTQWVKEDPRPIPTTLIETDIFRTYRRTEFRHMLP